MLVTQPDVWILRLPWPSSHTWWLINLFSTSCSAPDLQIYGDLGEVQILAAKEPRADPVSPSS